MPNVTGNIEIDFYTEKEFTPEQFNNFKKKLSQHIFDDLDTFLLEAAEEEGLEASAFPTVQLSQLEYD